jgi:hypothetical protein
MKEVILKNNYWAPKDFNINKNKRRIRYVVKSKKLVVLIIFGIVIATVLAGQVVAAAGEVVEITFLHHEAPAHRVAAFQVVIDLFEKEYPDIKVTQEVVMWGDAWVKTLAAGTIAMVPYFTGLQKRFHEELDSSDYAAAHMPYPEDGQPGTITYPNEIHVYKQAKDCGNFAHFGSFSTEVAKMSAPFVGMINYDTGDALVKLWEPADFFDGLRVWSWGKDYSDVRGEAPTANFENYKKTISLFPGESIDFFTYLYALKDM